MTTLTAIFTVFKLPVVHYQYLYVDLNGKDISALNNVIFHFYPWKAEIQERGHDNVGKFDFNPACGYVYTMSQGNDTLVISLKIICNGLIKSIDKTNQLRQDEAFMMQHKNICTISRKDPSFFLETHCIV